jgi:hypothetical protein
LHRYGTTTWTSVELIAVQPWRAAAVGPHRTACRPTARSAAAALVRNWRIRDDSTTTPVQSGRTAPARRAFESW